jgi:hypothetical protein
MTGGTGDKKYEYDRCVSSEILAETTLPEGGYYERVYDSFEGFYYNKIPQDVIVPLVAMILKLYFTETVERCQLDLSGYFLDIVQPKKKPIGY